MHVTERIGANIKARRLALGLTQEDLAGRSDVHPVEISRIESGQRDLRASTVVRLARALDAEPGALFVGAGDDDASSRQRSEA